MSGSPTPIEVFHSYAHKDESFRAELENHLSLLRRQGIISAWHDRHILPGTNWAQAIDEHLEQASIILLLVSADFLDVIPDQQVEELHLIAGGNLASEEQWTLLLNSIFVGMFYFFSARRAVSIPH